MLEINDLSQTVRDRAYELLPASIREISDLIGLDKTMVLVGRHGGKSMKFPRERNGAAWMDLEKLLGLGALEKLSQSYGGWERGAVYIPVCSKAVRFLRDTRIVARYDELTRSMSCRNAAKVLVDEFSLCDRSIQKIVNAYS